MIAENPVIEQEIQELSRSYPAQANTIALSIIDDATNQKAGEFLVTIKGFRKKVEEHFGPVVKKTYDAWKATVDLRKKADSPLDQAELIVKGAMNTYRREQDRIRAEEERKRIEASKKQQDDAKLKAAEEASSRGDHATANAIINQPTIAPAPVAEKPAAVAGVAFRDKWDFRIINADMIPREYLVVDEKKIGAVVRAMKDKTNIPGVEVIKDQTVSASSR